MVCGLWILWVVNSVVWFLSLVCSGFLWFGFGDFVILVFIVWVCRFLGNFGAFGRFRDFGILSIFGFLVLLVSVI